MALTYKCELLCCNLVDQPCWNDETFAYSAGAFESSDSEESENNSFYQWERKRGRASGSSQQLSLNETSSHSLPAGRRYTVDMRQWKYNDSWNKHAQASLPLNCSEDTEDKCMVSFNSFSLFIFSPFRCCIVFLWSISELMMLWNTGNTLPARMDGMSLYSSWETCSDSEEEREEEEEEEEEKEKNVPDVLSKGSSSSLRRNRWLHLNFDDKLPLLLLVSRSMYISIWLYFLYITYYYISC